VPQLEALAGSSDDFLLTDHRCSQPKHVQRATPTCCTRFEQHRGQRFGAGHTQAGRPDLMTSTVNNSPEPATIGSVSGSTGFRFAVIVSWWLNSGRSAAPDGRLLIRQKSLDNFRCGSANSASRSQVHRMLRTCSVSSPAHQNQPDAANCSLRS